MKINDNGVIRDMTAEEIAEYTLVPDTIPYEQRVVNRIRERYSVDDELALLRQRDTKPLECAEYNAFVEKVKTEVKAEE